MQGGMCTDFFFDVLRTNRKSRLKIIKKMMELAGSCKKRLGRHFLNMTGDKGGAKASSYCD